MRGNPILHKSFHFSVEVVTLYRYLSRELKEFILSKQLLRSGTSIGANVTEAQDAQSRKDFISKMNIALKEAKETRYWLMLLEECGYLNKAGHLTTYRQRIFTINDLFVQIEELIRMLSAIVKTSKQQ